MAQNARMSALTQELVQSILQFDPSSNKQAYKHAKEIASRGLRGYQYARTNQFEVQANLSGLDEKFRVKGRDDLADALALRLSKLEDIPGKFKPEFLSLLLQLADRPLENSDVKALELLRPPTPPPPLTWAEILHDDPYSDDEIWKDIDYAGGSSEDEVRPAKKDKKFVRGPATVDDDTIYDLDTCVVSEDSELVKDLESAQFWNDIAAEEDEKILITELNAIKETIYMLLGLRTNLFVTDQEQHTVHVNTIFRLQYVTSSTIDDVLLQFADTGKRIYRLRQWSKKASTLAVVQAFEDAVQRRLVRYDLTLANLQQRYLNQSSPVAVSLVKLESEVRRLSKSILRLSDLVAEVEAQILVNPFIHLEALFDQVTLTQITLEDEIFHYMTDIFFECLQTYLAPIRRWMVDGELGSADETFFIFANDLNSDISAMWHDRYVLRRDTNNDLRCPSFLHVSAKKIFNIGKSVVFLKELEILGTEPLTANTEPRLNRATVCGDSSNVPLIPFPELFRTAFDSWIQSKYSVASDLLCEHIMGAQRLVYTLRTLDTVFLSANGGAFEEFANVLFTRLDSGQEGWNDNFMLTDIARSVFSSAMLTGDVKRLAVRQARVRTPKTSLKALTTVSFDFALPWTLQNIIQRASITSYQQVFTFHLQSYRLKYLLQRSWPLRLDRINASHKNLVRKMHHKLIWFADMLRSYLTETVVFFSSHTMVSAMEEAEGLDEMSQIHEDFAKKLLQRALLAEELKPIYKAILELLEHGIVFAEALWRDQESTTVTAEPKPRARTKRARRNPVDAERSSDEDEEDNEDGTKHDRDVGESIEKVPLSVAIPKVDTEFDRLLPFITAGLRSISRAGTEPMWEQLAEKLEWQTKQPRP